MNETRILSLSKDSLSYIYNSYGSALSKSINADKYVDELLKYNPKYSDYKEMKEIDKIILNMTDYDSNLKFQLLSKQYFKTIE